MFDARIGGVLGRPIVGIGVGLALVSAGLWLALGSASLQSKAGSAQHLEVLPDWAVSPDDRWFAVPVRVRSGDQAYRDYLWLATLGDHGMRIVKRIADASSPAFSSTGQAVAFGQETARTIISNIREGRLTVWPLSSRSASALTAGYVDRDPAWDPTGRQIAFARMDYRSTGMRGWTILVSLDHYKPKRMRVATAAYKAVGLPRWRPRHDQISLIVQPTLPPTSGLQYKGDIYLLDAKVGAVRTLTTTGDVAPYSYAWSPDGKSVVFATGVGRFRTLEVLNVGTRKRRVAARAVDVPYPTATRVSSIRWSPKGNHIAFDVWKYDLGPTEIMCLTWPQLRVSRLTRDGKSFAPRWSADGRMIFFIRNRTEVWRMAPDGTQATLVYRLPPRVPAP